MVIRIRNRQSLQQVPLLRLRRRRRGKKKLRRPRNLLVGDVLFHAFMIVIGFVTPIGKAKTASDESFASLSSASSFADIGREPPSEEEAVSGSEDADGEGQADSDDEYIYEEESGQSYTSSSDRSDVPEEGEESEEDHLSSPPEPASIPLPQSRSPSTTPQLEIPRIRVTPSPSPSESSVSTESSAGRERSTTPPGTPVKEPSPPLRSSSTPVPTTSPSPPPFGLGRPSTRPTRSSPLASAPVSLEPEDDEDTDKTAVPVAQPEPMIAKPIEVPLKEDEDEEPKEPKIKPTRPKTPPLLSTLSSPSPPTPTTPILKPALSPSPTPASPAPFSLVGNRKLATPETPSFITPSPPTTNVFGDPTKPTTSVFGGLAPVAPTPRTPAEAKAVSAPVSFFPSAAPTAAPGASIFGASWTPQPAKPAVTTTQLPPFGLGPFSLKGKGPEKPTPTEAPLLFGKPVPPPQTPAPPKRDGLSLRAPSPPKPAPEVTMEEGMQKECAHVVFLLTQELASVSVNVCA